MIPGESILHIDMDAFYASVAVRDDETLRGKAIAVGGAGPRGVVTSVSYEARKFGVRAGMPSARARRLCADLIIVSPNFTRYTEESRAVMDIFFSFTPLVEPLSLDEAFLDVSGAVRLFGSPVEIAEKIRARVRAERHLVCSVGVAPNKLLAKLASAAAKPDGVVLVPAGGEQTFLDPLPVGALWGVGETTAQALDRLGVRTVAELRALPPGVLSRALGPALGGHLADIAAGRDTRSVVVHEPAKQVSAEETFDRDLDKAEEVNRELLRLAERVARRLRRDAIAARTVTVKIRFANFNTITRSRTLPEPTDLGARLYAAARDLFASLPLDRPRIRLLGVAATGLVAAASEQLRIGARPDPWREASIAMDKVRERFGSASLDLAAISDPEVGPPPAVKARAERARKRSRPRPTGQDEG